MAVVIKRKLKSKADQERSVRRRNLGRNFAEVNPTLKRSTKTGMGMKSLTGKFMDRTILDAPVKFSIKEKEEIEEWVSLMRV